MNGGSNSFRIKAGDFGWTKPSVFNDKTNEWRKTNKYGRLVGVKLFNYIM